MSEANEPKSPPRSRKKNKPVPMRMTLQAITLQQLSDGYVGRVIDEELGRISKDMGSRGGDKQKRKLKLEITFQELESGRCKLDVSCVAVLPKLVPPFTIAILSEENGGFSFSPNCAENPDQLTILPDVDEDGEIR